MNYDIIKYERGQVWVIRWKNPTQVGHEQTKDRPWLILSVGKFNKSSGMLTAVPITTRDNIRTPAQVRFESERGSNNVILCEQIRSFDYSSGAYIFDYVGQLSDEVLERVDVALSVHLGLHYSPITLKSLYDSMEAIIKSVGHMQQKADTPKFTDDDVIHFATKLQELAGAQVYDEISVAQDDDEGPVEFDVFGIPVCKETPSHHRIPPNLAKSSEGTEIEIVCDTDEASDYVKSADISEAKKLEELEVDKEVVSTEEPKTKSPRMKWTPELCKEYLTDCETLPMKKVLEKWNISKKTKYYSMKNYAQSLLTKVT